MNALRVIIVAALLLLLGGVAAASAGDLVCSFTTNTTSGIAPLTVQFTDTSPESTHWEWLFGDECSAHGQIVTHTYYEPGTYEVRHKVLNTTSGDVAYTTVSVAPPPGYAFDFTANVTRGVPPFTVEFTANVPSWYTNVSWYFYDGPVNFVEYGRTATHTYTSSGVTDVWMMADIDGDPLHYKDLNKVDYITATTSPLLQDFTANVTHGGAPLAVRFTANVSGKQPMGWYWDFNRDSVNEVSYVASTPTVAETYVYTTPGTYSVRVCAGNSWPDSPHFSWLDKVNYIVVTNEPQITAVSANVREGTAPLAVNLNATVAGPSPTTQWDYTNDGTLDATGTSVSTSYPPGTYSVRCHATNAHGDDTEVVTDYITSHLKGDWNENLRHDFADVTGLYNGLSGPYKPWMDMNDNGRLDFADVNILFGLV